MTLLARWHPVSRLVALTGPGLIAALLVADLVSGGTSVDGVAVRVAGNSDARSRPAPTSEPFGRTSAGIGSLASFEAMIEQPLFSPVRRAGIGASEEPASRDDIASLPSRADGIELVGTVVRDGVTRALVTRAGERRIESVGEGDTLEGWRIIAITGTALEIRSADGLIRKRLAFPRLVDPRDLTFLSSRDGCDTGGSPAETGCAQMAERNTGMPGVTGSIGQAG